MPAPGNITVFKLVLLAAGMFAFAFALVPLYGLICEVTGLGGKTGGPYEYDPAVVKPDRSRLVKVNFITNTNDGMVWGFWAESNGVRVHPGELKEVKFFVKNPTDRTMGCAGGTVRGAAHRGRALSQDRVFLLRAAGAGPGRGAGNAHAFHRRSRAAEKRAIDFTVLFPF